MIQVPTQCDVMRCCWRQMKSKVNNNRSFTTHCDTLPQDWFESACQFDPTCLKVQAACRVSSVGNLELKEHRIRLGSMSTAALR